MNRAAECLQKTSCAYCTIPGSPGIKNPLITRQNYQVIAFIFSFTYKATVTINIQAKLFFFPIERELFDLKTT